MTAIARMEVESIERGNASPLLARLDGSLGLVLREHVDSETAAGWARGVTHARADWTRDFGGEQFSLGRAFYTHLEQDRLVDYFGDARASDERVERAAPGLQERMRAIVRAVTGGTVVARSDFCGAGVPVFPASEKVARKGGVVHFDTEGLPASHVARQKRALSVVLTLQAPASGGGLRLWDIVCDPNAYDEAEGVQDEKLESSESTLVLTRPGDVVVFDSFRLHQIQPFGGDRDRISATLHAAETLRGTWEVWF